jgi:hypothetical protein
MQALNEDMTADQLAFRLKWRTTIMKSCGVVLIRREKQVAMVTIWRWTLDFATLFGFAIHTSSSAFGSNKPLHFDEQHLNSIFH